MNITIPVKANMTIINVGKIAVNTAFATLLTSVASISAPTKATIFPASSFNGTVPDK